MIIIALYGKSNTGKTTTLNLVIEDLKVSGAEKEGEEENLGLDQRCTLRLMDGRKVCITTIGDDENIQNENVAYVEKQMPDIWITAARTKGGSTGPLYGLLESKFSEKTFWVRKESATIIYQDLSRYVYAKDEPVLFRNSIIDRMNRIDADRILHLIDSGE